MNHAVRKKILAPGKLILIGEYAVLDGSPAVVMAVDRYASLSVHDNEISDAGGLVPFARRETARIFKMEAEPLNYVADSSDFYFEGSKLGLGGSAAVTVAAVASLFSESGFDLEDGSLRNKMWPVAKAIHDRFQDEPGSGLDICASIFGGVTAMRTSGGPIPDFNTWRFPERAEMAFVWTGSPSSTPILVRKVRQLEKSKPSEYRRIITEMSEVADKFITEGENDPQLAMKSVTRYASLMDELGRVSGTPIVTDAMNHIIKIAVDCGGAAKPSGAGGGDFVIAFFSQKIDKSRFLEEIKKQGYNPAAISLSKKGIHESIVSNKD